MIRHIPNALSSTRILLSLSLLFFVPFQFSFYLVYLLCGITDILDGYIARRYKVVSEFGSKLDSIGDVLLTFVVGFIILPHVGPPTYILVWTVCIILLRLVSMGVSQVRVGKAFLLHTTTNRVFALLLFLYPFVFLLTDSVSLLFTLCLLASLAAVEELVIMLHAPSINPDIRSLKSLRAEAQVERLG
ncbi:MAG: CDP-alcohol phosphatidyltransferase family protein [Raoultibacter sp.]